MDTSAMVIFSWTHTSKPQRYSMDNRFADTDGKSQMVEIVYDCQKILIHYSVLDDTQNERQCLLPLQPGSGLTPHREKCFIEVLTL